MSIDRGKALTWSKSRIIEEINDLRQKIEQDSRELSRYDRELDRVVDGEDPLPESRGPDDETPEQLNYPRLHEMRLNNALARWTKARETIEAAKDDIAFLKSLL